MEYWNLESADAIQFPRLLWSAGLAGQRGTARQGFKFPHEWFVPELTGRCSRAAASSPQSPVRRDASDVLPTSKQPVRRRQISSPDFRFRTSRDSA